MIDERALLKLPIEIPGVCYIYPPTVTMVATEPLYRVGCTLLTYTEEDIQDIAAEKQIQVDDFSPFHFLMRSCANKDFRTQAETFISLFTHEPTLIAQSAGGIVIGGVPDKTGGEVPRLRYIDEGLYLQFQNAVRISMGIPIVAPTEQPMDPLVAKVRKAARRREKIKRANTSKKGISLATSLAAICCMGIGLTPLNIGDISYASVSALMEMYQQKEKYDTDVSSLMAGADPKKVRPKYWIRDASDSS